MLKLIEINNIDDDTIKEWNTLWNISINKNYFNSLSWFQNCLEVYKIKNYSIIKIYNTNKIEAILPLIYIKRRIMMCAGDLHLDKNSLLFRNYKEEIIDLIIKYFKTSKRSIILNEVEESILYYFNKQNIIFEKASENPFIDLKMDVKEIIKPRERRNVENKIKKNTNLQFKIYYAKEVEQNIEIIFDIESRSNKVKRRRTIFNNKENRELFRNISKTDFPILCVLYDQDYPIAHMFGVCNSTDNFMAYNMAYDLNYAKYQPGKLVILHLIKELKNNNFNIFDFSRGNSVLKRHFSTNIITNYNIFINPTIIIRMKIILKKDLNILKQIIKNILKELKLWKKEV